jgi:ribonuclease HI
MELMAVIAGLSALKEPCAVLVTTDSKYVKQGLTEWLELWKKRSWVRTVKGLPGKQPVKNRDLWEQLEALKSKHSIKLEWVKGHAHHRDNNRCDRLAAKAARAQLSTRG